MIGAVWALALTNAALVAAIVAIVRNAQGERERLTAAAFQANHLPDAARRVVKSQEDERVRAHLKMQKELAENGGIFPEPPSVKKPEGI